jgi:CubicO group peptidase (beta-lactamase class C family)
MIRSTRRFSLPCLLLIVAGCLSLSSHLPGAEPDRTRLAGIRARMQQFVDDKMIAGAVTVVGTHDQVLSLECVGSQNLESGTVMQPETMFRIASMTKPITAIGIMLLVDEGKLSVEDPVEKRLPEFRGQMLVANWSQDSMTLKKPSRPITVRDLLTHTSGLPFMPPGLANIYTKRNFTLAEGVLVFSQRPLDFEPGSKWSYCNSGIDTLGRIIEVLSGQSYEGFLKQRIFDPLGMTDTTFYPSEEQSKRVAMTYNRKNGILVPEPNTLIGSPRRAKYAIPAGGLYSTAGDLARLYQMMLRRGVAGDKQILSEASVHTMTQNQTGDLKAGFTDGMGWGLGWGVVRKPIDVTEMLSPGTYGHGGAFGTQAWIDSHKDLFVVLLIQRTGLPNSDASDMRKELQRIAFAAPEK